MEFFILVSTLLACVGTAITAGDTSGNFEYDYSIKRDHMQEQERAFSGYQQSYTEDEQVIYSYLEYLKWDEFQKTRDDFPPARPIKLHLASVKASTIYRVLKRFPKGGNMHLHHNHVVSKSTVLDLIFNSSLYDNLYVKVNGSPLWGLDFFLNPPKGWAKVKGNPTFSKDELLKHSTFLEIMDSKAINGPTNSRLRWSEMGPLFSVIGSKVVNQVNMSKLHMEAMLQAAIDENVQYLETKSSSSNSLYILDPDPAYITKNGKRFIDNDDGELELNMVTEVLNEFKSRHPEFIGYKRILNSNRGESVKYVGLETQKALRLYQKYPYLVSGFDLVSEEDNGYSLLFFLEDFVNITTQNQSLPYFFHTAETNWPDDLLTSIHKDDPVATLENVYDAILLGARRVGHGIGFINHPYLMKILKERRIAIEVNPVSNKMLGYVPDQRHHPAITYLRYGIPVVLGADDPSTFGYDEFTVDWYEAFMGWGLNLADLRQLAMNSLNYSSLSPSGKQHAMKKWNRAWKRFIVETKAEACNMTFQNVVPTVSRILPSEGHSFNSTKIRVFGRDFRVSICKQILCRFGNAVTRGTFVYDHMITCSSPKRKPTQGQVTPLHVQFSVSLDNGLTYIGGTGTTFSYIHEQIPLKISGTDVIGK